MEQLNYQEQFEAVQSVEILSPEIQLGVEVVQMLVDNGEEAYFAGGFGRDLFLGHTPKDVDIATSASSDRVLEIAALANLENILFSMVNSAEALPVVQAKKDGIVVDIASFRKDTYEPEVVAQVDKKRRSVKTQTGATLLEDVERRDLTINTLMFDPLIGQIIDPLLAIEGEKPQSGVADLENKIIRFVGDARERIIEDRIRMIRAIRFKNRYSGFSYAPETSQVLTELAGEVSNISGERIRDEITKMLEKPSRAEAIMDLDKFAILEVIMPELVACQGVEQPKEHHSEGDVWQHTLETLRNLPEKASENLVWATLLHDIGKVQAQKTDPEKQKIVFYDHERFSVDAARKILNRMRFSNDQISEILWLIENHMSVRNIAQMRPSKQKQFSLPHLLNTNLKNESLAQDLLKLLWADNQSSVKDDGTVDQQSFDQAKKIIEKIIQESSNTALTIKEGLEGLKTVYEDTLATLKNGDEFVAFGSPQEASEALPKYLDDYIGRRIQKKISFRGIAPLFAYPKELIERDKSELREVRIVPPDKFPFQNEINIYGDKVAILSFKDQIGVILESRPIAVTQKAIFELAWIGAKHV